MSDVSTAARWEELKLFSVTVASPSDQLYANGRQQVQLQIAVEGLDAAGNSVKLSDREVDSIELIKGFGGEPVPFTALDPLSSIALTTQWSWSSERNHTYRLYPSARGEMPGLDNLAAHNTLPDSQVTYKQVYVQTTSENPLRIAASVTREDGTVFHSTQMNEGHVTVRPVRVPRYRSEEYSFPYLSIKSKGSPAYGYMPFSLRSNSMNIEFRSFSLTPSLFRSFPVMAGVCGVYLGFAEPGKDSISYGESTFLEPAKILRAYVQPGQPMLVHAVAAMPRTGSWDAFQSIVPPSNLVGKISAIDMHGNPHEVGIRFKPGENSTGYELF